VQLSDIYVFVNVSYAKLLQKSKKMGQLLGIQVTITKLRNIEMWWLKSCWKLTGYENDKPWEVEKKSKLTFEDEDKSLEEVMFCWCFITWITVVVVVVVEEA